MLSEETWGRVSSEGRFYSECPDALILEQLASEAAPPRALPTQPRFRSRPRLPRLPDPVPGPPLPPDRTCGFSRAELLLPVQPPKCGKRTESSQQRGSLRG